MATPSVHHIAAWTRRTLAKSASRSIKNYQLIYRLLNKTTLTYRWATICTFIPHHKDFWAVCLSLTFSKIQLITFSMACSAFSIVPTLKSNTWHLLATSDPLTSSHISQIDVLLDVRVICIAFQMSLSTEWIPRNSCEKV